MSRIYRKSLSEKSMVPLFLNGSKTTTLRLPPVKQSHWPKVGDFIQFFEWTGRPYWSPQRNLGKPVELLEVRSVTVAPMGFDGVAMGLSARDEIAGADGFVNWETMIKRFTARYDLPVQLLFHKFRAQNETPP